MRPRAVTSPAWGTIELRTDVPEGIEFSKWPSETKPAKVSVIALPAGAVMNTPSPGLSVALPFGDHVFEFAFHVYVSQDEPLYFLICVAFGSTVPPGIDGEKRPAKVLSQATSWFAMNADWPAATVRLMKPTG